MKKLSLVILLGLFLMPGVVSAKKSQLKNKAEVLYFKDRLPCCKGRSCNLLQSDVDSAVTKNFADKKVAFKVVYMIAPENKTLVEKYKAKSQTVLFVKKKRKKEIIVDLTPIVQEYKRTKNRKLFEESIQSKIKAAL